jgi:aconitate hydratase 2/2-methylisocitrate dehydratase
MFLSKYIIKNKNFIRNISTFKQKIDLLIAQRNKLNIEAEILKYDEVEELIGELKSPQEGEESFLLNQFKHRILPGVDDTSRLKANFLLDIVEERTFSPLIYKIDAINILGTMQGGYSIEALVKIICNKTDNNNDNLKYLASEELKKNILIFDYFFNIESAYNKGNIYAKNVLESWANAEWFTSREKVSEKIRLICFKVDGEINTDDLSPAQDAWSRPDIPLHAQSMLKNPREGIEPDIPHEIGPIETIELLKQKNYPIAFVGDVVGTGSSRKSATNSILWHFGKSIPNVPNKKYGGYCIGGKIAPIFFNTMEDSGALAIEMPVENIKMGQLIDIYPYKGITKDVNSGKEICKWDLRSPVLLDSVQAGGRINLIIGKSLTYKAQKSLNKVDDTFFIKNINKKVDYENISKKEERTGYTLAQKIVGKACNVEGIKPGTYCEPIITSVGSQDTTGPMTRDELKDLACLGFSADLVMQSFCHTAAYPKPVDIATHNTLPEFIHNRGGISLRPGDGIIHSWLNRMLLPDTVGTGGDSHTRFPIGISFPAGSGLVAFAGATGVMPLDMPESVLVRFTGNMQPGITLRDIVHSIPYFARKNGLLTLDKKNKKNVFNGNILEIEGLPNLTCEQAFELSDASAERSSAGCTIKLNKEPIIEYLESNISLLKWMINEGYNDKKSIERRIIKMKEWIKNPVLLEADKNAKYKEIIEINLDNIVEPILCAPNDPDHAVLLSEVQGKKVDEVFIGSCMTNIGHFRAAGKLLEKHQKFIAGDKNLKTKLWMAPPTKMDEKKLIDEGFYDIYKSVGVRTEMPGCSLCMGNQARVEDNATVLSTSTRNFPNRLGKGANVFLASAELSAITAIEGVIPSLELYNKYFESIEKNKKNIFNYMNFNKLEEYKIIKN